jgi:hypothetical protein
MVEALLSAAWVTQALWTISLLQPGLDSTDDQPLGRREVTGYCCEYVAKAQGWEVAVVLPTRSKDWLCCSLGGWNF